MVVFLFLKMRDKRRAGKLKLEKRTDDPSMKDEPRVNDGPPQDTKNKTMQVSPSLFDPGNP